MVVQWKLPEKFSSFIQRAGRAARDHTRVGVAILLVEPSAYNERLPLTLGGDEKAAKKPRAKKGEPTKEKTAEEKKAAEPAAAEAPAAEPEVTTPSAAVPEGQTVAELGKAAEAVQA